jgi:hypothetical protein
MRLLLARFGTLDSAIEERIATAAADTLDRWFDRALHATTLDEVFSD